MHIAGAGGGHRLITPQSSVFQLVEAVKNGEKTSAGPLHHHLDDGDLTADKR